MSGALRAGVARGRRAGARGAARGAGCGAGRRAGAARPRTLSRRFHWNLKLSVNPHMRGKPTVPVFKPRDAIR